jgi:hypothetical protein
MATTTTLAWHWGYPWFNDFAHGFGAFLTSSGLAGLAAVGAASIAAWQVSKTRRQDKQNRVDDREADEKARQIDALWTRFAWVVDQLKPPEKGGSAFLASQAAPMLDTIQVAAGELGETQLSGMITAYRRAQLQSLLQQIGPI